MTGQDRCYRAPGRVNLIGEHTDYNDGFVLPAALDLATWVTAAPRADRKIAAYSGKFDQKIVIDLDDPAPQPRKHWSDYVQGVALALEQAGRRLSGADLSIRSDVPFGAGLSSSAALEVAVGYALLDLAGIPVDRVELARLCQKAENSFVGMNCGIMDQFISCHGQEGHALMLDCRSLEARLAPLPQKEKIVIVDSMVKHSLASSEYNLRRQECERGVALLSSVMGPIRALRDVEAGDLEAHAALLPDAVLRRCRHIVTENARVLKAVEALDAGDAVLFGALMNESYVSYRDDFQASCREIDLLIDMALGLKGVFGSRLTGGGFGGCTVSLVAEEEVESFSRRIEEGYQKAVGKTPRIFICSPGPGVERVS